MVHHEKKNFCLERILIQVGVDLASRSFKRTALIGYIVTMTVKQSEK